MFVLSVHAQCQKHIDNDVKVKVFNITLLLYEKYYMTLLHACSVVYDINKILLTFYFKNK